ncbi:nSTAND3 domain-containing NTPase [Aeromicrobium fastidiosum]|uniref:AAA+ ATPase domain-containing protein n=1 Tax=Aeromicrobium fastidiosum TaxID=52699 RepID=A0A641AKK6_9ACTN|nr:hypothetical protein ESP62_012995 [Aeromicrobium fastidiosum]MBP2391755.1 hypothetical protein [Aeromicrobium fastidiosum]
MTDIDFEELSADLLGAEFNTRIERFGRGADGGIDLRWRIGSAKYGIAQCKHYLDSSFGQLKASASKEIPKVRKLKPARYVFATSRELTVHQKGQICDLFDPWMRDPSDVFSGMDLDQLLDKNETVDRKHVKLWLATGAHLFWAMHPELASRSEALRERIDRTISNYVGMGTFERAKNILEKEKVCLIAGQPGVGKTVLAHMLIADHMRRGFDVVEVSGDIDEAWTALDPNRPQVFIYDDFLGQLAFSERLGKNEDSRLSDFVDKIRFQKSTRLILTTREYILRDARIAYSRLDGISRRGRYILELKHYSRNDRARILYNHAWRSGLSPSALSELSDGGWKRIIDHPNFSPRLVEYGTRLDWDASQGSWLDAFVYALDNPSTLWRRTFESHLTDQDRALLFVLASFSGSVELEAVKVAYRSLLERLSLPFSSAALKRSLETLEGTFIAVNQDHRGAVVQFHNPSIVDFVLNELQDDTEMQRDLIRSATHFEQLERLWASQTATTTVSDRSGTSASRSKVLSSLAAADYSAAADRLYTCDPLAPRTNYHGSASESLEDRFAFVVSLPAAWRPKKKWLKSHAVHLLSRWTNHKGDKTLAYDFIFGARSQARDFFPPAAEAVLEDWLKGELSVTEDWRLLGLFLASEGTYPLPGDYAERFTEHAEAELERWDPAPPELSTLRSLSDDFGTYDLDAYFDEASERENQSDEATSETAPESERGAARDLSDTDSAISAYFDRF